MQDHALCCKFLLDRTRHVSSPFDLTSTDLYPIRSLCFAHRAVTCKPAAASAACRSRQQFFAGTCQKTGQFGCQFLLFREAALVAAQYDRH
jgi:hypothetical protein